MVVNVNLFFLVFVLDRLDTVVRIAKGKKGQTICLFSYCNSEMFHS